MTTRSAVPANVTKQKEDAYRQLDDLEKKGGDAKGTPGQPAPQDTPPEPPKPGEGTPPAAPAPAAPAPTDAEDPNVLKDQIAKLSKAITDLQAVIADENRDTWKQKFLVMDGKYKAETAPALKRASELDAENKRLVAELEGARKTTVVPVEAAVTDFDKKIGDKWGVDPAELAEYRQNITDAVISRISKQAPAAQPAQPQEPEPAQKPAASNAAQQPEPTESESRAIEAYKTLLDVKAPGWTVAQADPKFLTWLQANRDQYIALAQADRELDAETVAKVYRNYFRAQPAEPAPAAPERPSREAAPSSSKGGSGSPGTQADAWPLERVQQFEQDVASGKIRMGSEEYKTLKASRDAFLAGIKFV